MIRRADIAAAAQAVAREEMRAARERIHGRTETQQGAPAQRQTSKQTAVAYAAKLVARQEKQRLTEKFERLRAHFAENREARAAARAARKAPPRQERAVTARALVAPVGSRYGLWTVRAVADSAVHGYSKRVCECRCGTVRVIAAGSLRSGATRSCGCILSLLMRGERDWKSRLQRARVAFSEDPHVEVVARPRPAPPPTPAPRPAPSRTPAAKPPPAPEPERQPEPPKPSLRMHVPVRADCAAMPRPCLATACRWHLKYDLSPFSGRRLDNFPGLEPSAMRETCALDVADRGGATLEAVGDLLGVSRERIRQIETRALAKVARRAPLFELGDAVGAASEP